MSLSQNFAHIGEDLVNSLKARLEALEALHAEIKDLLEKYHRERTEMSEKLKQILTDDRLNRLEEVNNLINSFHEDRTQARNIWRETLAAMEKLRKYKTG